MGEKPKRTTKYPHCDGVKHEVLTKALPRRKPPTTPANKKNSKALTLSALLPRRRNDIMRMTDQF